MDETPNAFMCLQKEMRKHGVGRDWLTVLCRSLSVVVAVTCHTTSTKKKKKKEGVAMPLEAVSALDLNSE